MATQRVYYRLTDMVVQYIDYYTTTDSSASTGPNTSTQQDILGFYESDSYSSFVAALDYSLPANCSGLSGTYENWVDDFWAGKHIYYAIPSAYSIYMGAAIVQQNNYHYGVWYYNRSSETPTVSANDQGFIVRMTRYPDDQTAASVSGYFGGTLAPYTKGIFLMPSSGDSSVFGRSKFLNKSTAAAYSITNSGWFDAWSTGHSLELKITTDDAVGYAPGFDPSGMMPTPQRYSPSIQWYGGFTPTLFPGGSAAVTIYNINTTAPGSLEMFVVGYEQSAQSQALAGNGIYIDANHAWTIHLTRPAITSAWTGAGVSGGASDGSSVTVTASFGIAGNWVVKALEAYNNLETSLLSVTVSPLTTTNYYIYTWNTSGGTLPQSADWGFINRIDASNQANLVNDPLYYGVNGQIATSLSGASPQWYSLNAQSWYVSGPSTLGVSLNTSGYNSWVNRIANNKRYKISQGAGFTDGAVLDCGTLPADRTTIGINMPYASGSLVPDTWHTVNVSGISSGAMDLLFKASLIKASNGSTRSCTGFMVGKSGAAWPNGDAASALFYLKIPTSQNSGGEASDYFRLEVMEGFGNAAATSTYAGSTTQRQINATYWRGNFYAWYTKDGTTNIPRNIPTSSQAYSPRSVFASYGQPGQGLGYEGTIFGGNYIWNVYPITMDDSQFASWAASTGDILGPSGGATIATFGDVFAITSGNTCFVPAACGGLETDLNQWYTECKFGVTNSSGYSNLIPLQPQIGAENPHFQILTSGGGFLPSAANYSLVGGSELPINGSVAFPSGQIAYACTPVFNYSAGSSYYALSGYVPANSQATQLNFMIADLSWGQQTTWWSPSGTVRAYYRGFAITRPTSSSAWPKPSGGYWDSASTTTFGVLFDVGGLTGGGKTWGIHNLDNYGSNYTRGTTATNIGLYAPSANLTVTWNHRFIIN